MRTFGFLSSARPSRFSFSISLARLTLTAATLLLSAIGLAAQTALAQTNPATATALTITSSSGVATTVTVGTVVTLSATVTAGSAHLTIGQVEFCDASSPHCTDIHLLGVAQLTAAGTATLKFRPGPGGRSYKAIFPGTNTYARSTSAVSALTVTALAGPFATSTAITESGSAGNYTLTAAVTEAGQTTGTSGSVSFLDENHANAVLATETLGPPVAGVSWISPISVPSLDISSAVVTDLNGDGIADLVVDSNPVVIFLGHADGTYTQAPALPGFGPELGAIAVADFNGDGIPDLAVGMYSSPAVAILLGNGDGTFQAPIEAALPSNGTQVSQLVSADFNGDGIADLLVVDNYDSVLTVLLGVGNGRFTSAVAPSLSVRPSGVAVGDFNGDGKPDFVVGDSYSDVLTVLTGNGDGTFTATSSFHSGLTGTESGGNQIASADFNADGKLDIAVVAGGNNGSSETVSVFTGNGDGTFNTSAQGQSATGSAVTGIQIADFNQDGFPDAVLSDANGNVYVLLNNGSGVLGPDLPVVLGLSVPYSLSVGVGDLNGDGYPDIAAGGYYNGTLGLHLTLPTETATAVAPLSLSAGLHEISASFAGSIEYTTSVSPAIPLYGIPPATTTTLTVTSGGSPTTSVAPGTVVTLTAKVTASATPVTAGQVNFCDATAAFCTDIHILGTATLTSNGSAVFSFAPSVGTHSLKAVFVQNGLAASSSSSAAALAVGPAPTPVYTDTPVITASGYPGNYALTATVAGAGGTAPVTGSINFVDTSFANASLGIASLGQSVYGIGWGISQTPALAAPPVAEVQGDFNGDGIPDLALLWTASIYGEGPYSVTIFFGTGKGTFTTGPTTVATGVQTSGPMITGDFNGDGKTDLALMGSTLSYDGVTVTVMLSNGDGTFAAPKTTLAYNPPPQGGDVVAGSIVAADFNGDGKMDLALVGGLVASGEVTILMGAGDGTFTSSGASYGYASSFSAIGAGDFNGDQIPDLVVTNYFAPAGTYVLLGKGDGTFAALPTTLAIDSFTHSIVVGDFNLDGKPDLAFGYSSGVGIFLGAGDGTFTQATGSPFTGAGVGLVAGDFNHDGKLDLAGIDAYNDNIDVQIGAGDGSFQEVVATPSVNAQGYGNQIAVADFNNDGVVDLSLITSTSDSAQILLTAPTETATATISNLAPVGAGTHIVDASYSGDSNYPTSVSPTISLIAGLAPIIISPATGNYPAGQLVTLSESVPGSTIYYAVSGPVYTSGFQTYTGPILLNLDGTESVQAYATETGYQTAQYITNTYTLSGTAPAGTTAATVTVTPSTTSVTDAQSLTVTVGVSGATGQPTPTGSATLSAGTWTSQLSLTSGSATFTVPANTLFAGNDLLSATYSGDATYKGAVGTDTIAVSPIASSGHAPASVTAGSPATSTISFFASHEYSGTLNATCSLTASPAGAQNLPTCSLSPASLPLTFGATGTTTLTIQTTAPRTTASTHPLATPFRWLGGGGATLAAVLLFLLPTRRRRRWLSLSALMLGFLSLGIAGCGGGSNNSGGGGQVIPGTTAGNYTFTVTAVDTTNKLITTSTTVIITVN